MNLADFIPLPSDSSALTADHAAAAFQGNPDGVLRSLLSPVQAAAKLDDCADTVLRRMMDSPIVTREETYAVTAE